MSYKDFRTRTCAISTNVLYSPSIMVSTTVISEDIVEHNHIN